MGFTVYRNATRDRMVGDYATLDEALAALRKGYLLVLPAGTAPSGPLAIGVDGVTVDLHGAPVDIAAGALVTKLTLTGTGAATVDTHAIDALGSIRVTGSDGGLTIAGGAGRDMATGGAGLDHLDGGAGDDVLTGGGGADELIAGLGRDRLYGGDGDDLLFAGQGERATLDGGTGADILVIEAGSTGTTIVTGFDAASGDRLILDGLTSFDDLMASGAVTQGADQTVIRWGGAQIQLLGVQASSLGPNSVGGSLEQSLEFDSFEAFLASGTAAHVDEVTIGGVAWHLRTEEPLHDDHKGQDASGAWWSPDYLVVVAGGQSNMTGAGQGAPMTLSGNVVAWDWVNGELIPASYDSAPANGLVVRTGTTLFNNLYFPFAEELAASSGQPVMVIAHPVSGSQIETWVGPGDINWETLEADVVAGLAAIGQDSVDAFLWLQGESDYPDSSAGYEAQVYALIDQIRSAGWGGDEVAILLGELSREGVNQTQNAALQRIELAETDPYLAFVSSTGFTTTSPDGVHYDGASLVEYGSRFHDVYEAMMNGDPVPPNTAPTVAANAPIPASITVVEGQTAFLDMSAWFDDAEGDPLWYYGTLSKRGVYLIDPVDGGVVIEPDFNAAGDYVLHFYANDFLLDGPSVDVTLHVVAAPPAVSVFSSRDFGTLLAQSATFAEAMAGISNSRGVEILAQSALSSGTNLVTADSLTIRGAAGIAGELTLATRATRLWLDGAAALDVRGGTDDNYVQGNAGTNTLWGGDGIDRLYGNAGDDHLMGDRGNDTLYGGDGADRLVGAAGNDMAYGGTGADTIVFAAGSADIRIRDWQNGVDVIEVDAFAGVGSYAELMARATITQSASTLTLAIGTDRLILDAATAAMLSADDFIFA